MQLGELEAHLHAQLRVEIGERLVEQKNLRLAHERPADRDPMALSAGKLRRPPVEKWLELQDARDFERAFILRFSRRAGDGERKGDVLPDRHVGIERIGLEHHRDAALRRRRVGHVDAIDEAISDGDLLEAGDHPQERGLAASRRTQERGEGPLLNR